MQEMSKGIQVEWRRRQVFELSSKGLNQVEIARRLQIHESTISRDLDYLREQSKENIRKYVDERLPEEYEKCLVGLTAIQKEAWTAAERTEDTREKMQALSLAKECYGMKLELLTNATVVDDAIRFVDVKAKKVEESKDNTIKEDAREVKVYDIREADDTSKDSNNSYNTTF